jgi:hypothetical protein
LPRGIIPKIVLINKRNRKLAFPVTTIVIS